MRQDQRFPFHSVSQDRVPLVGMRGHVAGGHMKEGHFAIGH